MADVLPSDELIDEPSDYGEQRPGHRLGRYELLVPIARGGMARVWAARLHGQRGFQKLVAIKTILPHLADEPEFERMFLDEARIASGVHHPNVCEIYELGEEKRTLYLAMEWVSGDSLARVLRASGKTEALDPRVVARVIADACAGLHAAHELTDDDGRSLGVVHRDLSPHNILLTADGTAKVADFGVAKALGQLHEATSAGQLKGKIAYMAPEQVTGSQIDRRSDVFSLGCVLYEATTGQRPFRGDGDHQVMHAVLKGEYAAPSTIIRNYPQELERIVARALSQQPILRYPTAERMRFALEEYVARGQLVTQSNVAQVVRARIGEQIDRRKERIRKASSAVEREGGWSEPSGGMTPSNDGHRSGVRKPSGQHAAVKPLYTTMQMQRPEGVPLSMAPLTPHMGPMPGMIPAEPPASSTTIPQAAAHPFAQGAPPAAAYAAQGHTPVSHPGAAFSEASHPQVATPPPPPAHQPLAQTALMPPIVSMPAGLEAPPTGAPQVSTEQMRPFTLPPVSSAPPAMLPQAMQQPQPQGPMAFPPQSQGVPQPMPPSGPYDMPAPAQPADGNPPAGAGQYAMAVGVGVLLAVLIGVGGFYAWSRRAAPVPSTDTSTTAPVSSASGGTAPSAAPGSSAAALSPVSADIVFRIVPSEAILSVDGRALGPEVRTVPRPEMGKTLAVVAKAPGYEDTTILVDYFTTSPMELTLKAPADRVTLADAASGAPVTGEKEPVEKEPPPKKEPAKTGEGGRPRQGGGTSGLPANPY